MRKKNHARRNQTGKGSSKKLMPAKPLAESRKEEVTIFLQIQNLINDDIVKQKSENSNVVEFKMDESDSDCDMYQSDANEAVIEQFLDTDLSKFVSLSSDSEDDYGNFDDEKCNNSGNTEYIEPDKISQIKNDEEIFKQETILNNYKNSVENNSESGKTFAKEKELESGIFPLFYHNLDEVENENIQRNDPSHDLNNFSLLNKPLLSLCEDKEVKAKINDNNNGAPYNLKATSISNNRFHCPKCPRKYVTLHYLNSHLLMKHGIGFSQAKVEKKAINHIPKAKAHLLTEQLNSVITTHCNSIKMAMTKIIKGRLIKLLRIEYGDNGYNGNLIMPHPETNSLILLDAKLVDRIVNISETRLDQELSKFEKGDKENDEGTYSDFEI